MTKGILLECKEELEVVNWNIKFLKGIYYLGVPIEEGMHVIDREHKPLKLNIKIFKKHFKIV